MKQPSSARAPTQKHVILFMAANPAGTDRLALDHEARAIHIELKRSGYRHRFEFVTRWAAEPLDLLRELRELRPTIVHFSGHGARPVAAAELAGGDVCVANAPSGSEPGGVVFEGANGFSKVVTPAAFAQTLDAAGSSVRLVVLNACYTASIAEALLAHIDCVVGMSGAIHDDAARNFAIGFYGGLGEHESIAVAFKQGRAAIHLDGLPDADRPQLQVRDGFDAAGLIPAAVAPSVLVAVPCPYPGMRPFAADDANSFHGRDAEIAELIGRLRAGERELFVIGPSGSGKSSLVTAGVLPRLARGVTGLGPFVVRELRPGEQPAARLGQVLEVPAGDPLVVADRVAALLAHRGPSASLLIVVDQLEELFTLAAADERAPFLGALSALRAERRCAVVFTLRADFFGALMESTLWAERRGQLSRVEVSPLHGESLREAIAAPASAVGVTVEPELIDRLLSDAASEPGILPLLQETMVQLWDERADQTLTLADYQALGDGDHSGLAVALVRRADATLRRFTTAQTAIARRILLRLISFGEGRSDTRRQQPPAKLSTAADDTTDFAYVLQQLVDNRLLTIDDDNNSEPRVDLAHEIMISAWPALTGWIQSHRAAEQRRRELEAVAAQWGRYGRGPRGLLDPIELADAEMWLQTESARQVGGSCEVKEFIAASSVAQNRRRRRRRGLLVGAFAVLAGFGVVVTVLAIAASDQADNARRETNNARDQARLADQASVRARHLLAQSYMESGRELFVGGHHQEAVAYLLEARRSGLDSAPLRMMFRAASRDLPLTPALLHQGEVTSAAFSPDGSRVVTTSKDRAARVWETATGKTIILQHQDEVTSAAFSPDGTRVVTASWDKTARVWDAATGKPIIPALQHQDAVTSAVFSPDGLRIVTASNDKTARVWDAVTGKAISIALQHQGPVTSAAFSPDGSRIVTASKDKSARVWDATTGQPVAHPLEHQDAVWSAAFSPDGASIVTASEDKTARVWDATTSRPVTIPLEHQAEVMSAAFSPDGTRIVTMSNNRNVSIREPTIGTARVWNAFTGKLVARALEPQGWLTSAAFSPDGTRVVTAGNDKRARVWDADTGKPLAGFEHQAAVMTAAFSPDGARIVTASADKTARVWDADLDFRGLELVGAFQTTTGVERVAFSPDSTRIVIVDFGNAARVLDAATGKPVTRPLVHQGQVESAAFSPDGTRVVTASWDHSARVWDAVTGNPVTGPLEHHDKVTSAAFSLDGSRIVTTSYDQTARVWDASTGKPLSIVLQHRGWVASAAFSPDGARVVTGSYDRTARVWEVATGKPVTSPIEHQAPVMSVAFSPDGTSFVTASGDKTARVWDATTGKPITSPFEHQDVVLSAAFSPDGTRIVTASYDNTARVWDATTGKPITSSLDHRSSLQNALFSPDGTHVITTGSGARIWDSALDTGTLDEWSTVAERSPFVLNESGVLVRRSATRTKAP